jgi:hypothetical protein
MFSKRLLVGAVTLAATATLGLIASPAHATGTIVGGDTTNRQVGNAFASCTAFLGSSNDVQSQIWFPAPGIGGVVSQAFYRDVRLHNDGSVAALDAFFEQHCEQPTAAPLFGHAVYKDLRSYTFTSDATNPLGLGQAGGYHAPDSAINASYDGRNIHMTVIGNNDAWTIDMTPPRLLNFTSNMSFPIEGGARNNVGALNVTRNGRSCSRPTGHLNVSTVGFSGSTVSTLAATFDVVCQGSAGVLNGELNITS